MRDPALLTTSSSVPKRDAGVRLIIAYKLIKGSAAMALALTLLVLLLLHETAPLEQIGVHVHHHFTGAWSVQLATLLLSAAAPHHLWLVTAALLFDSSLTLVEGWALYHGHWWGPWLVVIATGSLVPFEVVALMHQVKAGRLALLVLNALVVAYLVWRTRREVAEKRKARPL